MFSFKRLTLPLVGLALVLTVVASLTPSIGRAQPTQQPATPDQADLALWSPRWPAPAPT